MAKFIIEGGYPLEGTVEITGFKNAALPIMAAALLSEEPSIIKNVPDISDVHILADIIAQTGAEISQIDRHTWSISGANIRKPQIDPRLAHKLRASILLVGPLLARYNKVLFPHPGGCLIGQRPVDTHFEALYALGADIYVDKEFYVATAKHLKGTSMFLDEVSVTATENAMMLAVLSPGETVIKPAACEPHVEDLARFLRSMGAQIEGEGTHTIKITGVEKLNGVNGYSIIPDNIEAGTFAIAAIATKGNVTIKNIIPEHLESIVHKLKQMGANIEIKENELIIKKSKGLKSARIQIDTWPRVPTDLQAPFGVLATQATGTSLIHEWMYDRRLSYTEDLLRMGANVVLCDPHRALITGPSELHGTKIKSPDIRAGVALVIAALAAEGKTEIDRIELVDRGYEDIEKRLRTLGAHIKRVEE